MGDVAYVALLHGSAPEFFAYALVLGRRLSETASRGERVLLLGPGAWRAPAARWALAWAGWTRAWYVHLVDALA